MRTAFLAVLMSASLSMTAYAQGPGAGGRRAPVDHWMTIDSLVAAVGVTDAQRPEVTKHYEELNAVMKKAADERAKMFQAGGGERPSQEQMTALRSKLDFMQGDLDKHYKAIRGLLNADQQAKFDALPAPRVAMRQRPQGGGGN
jgi:hypothetical protein